MKILEEFPNTLKIGHGRIDDKTLTLVSDRALAACPPLLVPDISIEMKLPNETKLRLSGRGRSIRFLKPVATSRILIFHLG